VCVYLLWALTQELLEYTDISGVLQLVNKKVMYDLWFHALTELHEKMGKGLSLKVNSSSVVTISSTSNVRLIFMSN